MFEKASRLKIRFQSPKGELSVEDLWDLPLTSQTGKANLDDIAKDIHTLLKSSGEVSFVEKTAPQNETAQLGFEIVKHIISIRLAENQSRLDAREKSEKKQRLMEILNRKEDQALEELSPDQIRDMINSM